MPGKLRKRRLRKNSLRVTASALSLVNHRSHDIFGPGSNVSGRVIRDYDKIEEIVKACRQLGLKIVLTSGTYDLLHVGHSRYLEKAKEFGDILIVGVESDAETRKRKGPHRPIVSEDERVEILCHLRHVDLVFLRDTDTPKWPLIRKVRPDVLITTKGGFSEQDMVEIKEFCHKVVVLEPLATTSTTAKIRRVLVVHAGEIRDKVRSLFQEVDKYLEELSGADED